MALHVRQGVFVVRFIGKINKCIAATLAIASTYNYNEKEVIKLRIKTYCKLNKQYTFSQLDTIVFCSKALV